MRARPRQNVACLAMGVETEGYSRFFPPKVRGAQAEQNSRLLPRKVSGAQTEELSRLFPPKVRGAQTVGHSRLFTLKVWRAEPEEHSRLLLLDPRARGTKRIPLCLRGRMMDGPGEREPPGHTVHVLVEVEIGPPWGPRMQRSYRPPYGILWTL